MRGLGGCPTRNARGSATTELTLLVPLLVGLLLLVVLAGRVTAVRNDTVTVARDAARAASLAATPSAAAEAARTHVLDALASSGCSGIAVDTRVEAGPEGHMAGGLVVVDVACDAALGDLALLAVPGSVRLRASGTESIDRYRSR